MKSFKKSYSGEISLGKVFKFLRNPRKEKLKMYAGMKSDPRDYHVQHLCHMKGPHIILNKITEISA